MWVNWQKLQDPNYRNMRVYTQILEGKVDFPVIFLKRGKKA